MVVQTWRSFVTLRMTEREIATSLMALAMTDYGVSLAMM